MDGDAIVAHVDQLVAPYEGAKAGAQTVNAVPIAGQQRSLLAIPDLARVWRQRVVQQLHPCRSNSPIGQWMDAR